MRRIFMLLVLLLPLQALARTTETVRDLPQIRASGELRVLINQSRHSSGVIGDQTIGVELPRLEAFRQYLNTRAGATPVKIKLIPLPGPELYPALLRGEGDLVASAELLGPVPSAQIIASDPISEAVPLVVVARRGNRQYRDERGLTGRFFLLPAGSVAKPALQALSSRLKAQGLAPVDYRELDSTLAVEDVLDLVHSGAVLLTVMEQPIAERWASVYSSIRIDRHLPLANDGVHAWYLHRKSPALRAKLAVFSQQYQSPVVSNANLQRIYRQRYRLQNPLGRQELARLRRVQAVLEKHAQAHGLDWRLLAAIGFKESTLNPQARGAGHAIGLMQITPATARANGVSDARSLDNNVLAASRYLVRLRDRFFASPKMPEQERRAFMLAAYNMGPQRVARFREEASRRGLNADRWFFNVERIALEDMGLRGGNYVNALNKYYLIYRREGEDLGR